MRAAIVNESEPAVRALVRAGANIDQFEDVFEKQSGNAAAFAISTGSVSMLALCHDLGASFSCVSDAHSAVEFAIYQEQPACLAYLLDHVDSTRPVHLSPDRTFQLCYAAERGRPVLAIYKILATRGFDFKRLERQGVAVSVAGRSANLADVLLMRARESGDKGLIRYLVKDLGIVSSAGHIDAAMSVLGAMKDEVLGRPSPAFTTPPDALLAKYKCAACDAVSATKVCSGCKMARYCSAECQTRHWKTGGHKVVCKEHQRQTSSPGAAGSSQS